MNREILPQIGLAMTIGLFAVIVAVYRTQAPPKPGVWRRGAVAALLVYAVVSVPVFVTGGMTAVGLVLLLIVLVLPLLALRLSLSRRTSEESAAESATRVLVAAGLAAALLIAAGQSLSLLGRVDPRTVVIVIAVIAALVVIGQGLAAGSRAGSLAVWLLILPALIAIALGIFLGSVKEAVVPIIEVAGPAPMAVLAIALAVFVIGWCDAGLRQLVSAASGTTATDTSDPEDATAPDAPGPGWGRIWLAAAVIVVVIAFGQLMFLGGAVLAPSLQFFVLPANLDLVPGLAPVLLAIATVLFTALVAIVLAGVKTAIEPVVGIGWPWVAGVAGLAAVIGLFDPGLDRVLLVTSLAAAALVGAQLGGRSVNRGVVAGLVTAIICVIALAVASRLTWEVAAVLATAVVLVVALAGARLGSAEADDSKTSTQESSA